MKTLVLLHGWGASGAYLAAPDGGLRRRRPRPDPGDSQVGGRLAGGVSGRGSLRESVLVGWSLGGMLLLEALARLEGPTPLATVLVGVAPVFCRRPDHPWGQPVAAVRAMRRALRSDPRRVINDFARACLAPGEESYRPEVAAGFDFTATAAHLAQGLDYLRDKDLRGLLPAYSGPSDHHPGGTGQDRPPGPGAVSSGAFAGIEIAPVGRRRTSAFLNPGGSL